MSTRALTSLLAVVAIAVAAGAAYATRSWMPLVMIAPIGLIVLVNSGRGGR